jgi:hypothetical protein
MPGETRICLVEDGRAREPKRFYLVERKPDGLHIYAERIDCGEVLRAAAETGFDIDAPLLGSLRVLLQAWVQSRRNRRLRRQA